MIVAGIDEAGYGPVLGPLIVTGTYFHVPDALGEHCLWTLLSPEVSRKHARNHSAVAVADSKKLFTRKGASGAGPLERGVLAMLGAGAGPPGSAGPVTLASLIEQVCPGGVERLNQWPWYGDLDVPLPRFISPDEAMLAANAVRGAGRRVGVSFGHCRAELFVVAEFNRLVEATRNKSVVLLDAVGRLLTWLWRQDKGRSLVTVDRLGGRMHYLPLLQRTFDGASIRVLGEDDGMSAYIVSDRDRSMRVAFRVQGESHQLPVALSSMVSKYLREMLMERMNGFWARRVAGLAPTAGYYQDGRRFFDEIRPCLRQAGIAESAFYRNR